MGGPPVTPARPLRILLFGDGAWAAATLDRLLGRHAVVAVVLRSRPSDRTLQDAAESHGIALLQPADVNAPAFVERMRCLAPELALSVSYDQILRAAVLNVAPLGFVNLHAAKLPRYRGRNVINWAIINGEAEIGITAHFVDEGIDTGDIIVQHTLPIGWTDTYGMVLGRVIDALPDVAIAAVELVAGGAPPRERQAHLPGTYFARREQGDEWLDWSDTSTRLHNKVRAISRPGPGARTLLGDRPVIVWRAFYDPAWPRYAATPGQVVGRHPDGILVKTGDSTLLVQEVQRAGHTTETPSWRVGTRLGVDLAAALRAMTARLEALETQRA